MITHVSRYHTLGTPQRVPRALGKRGGAWNHLDPKIPAAYQSTEPTRAQGPGDGQAATDQEQETKGRKKRGKKRGRGRSWSSLIPRRLDSSLKIISCISCEKIKHGAPWGRPLSDINTGFAFYVPVSRGQAWLQVAHVLRVELAVWVYWQWRRGCYGWNAVVWTAVNAPPRCCWVIAAVAQSAAQIKWLEPVTWLHAICIRIKW